jgi:hypothetical protein
VQCITCGEDAPKWSSHMPWADFMKLSDSISEVKAKKGLDLLLVGEDWNDLGLPGKIYVFMSSDPIFYHSDDAGLERTIFDIAKVISQNHNRGIYITTAGWPTGNNYMQQAVEKMIAEGMLEWKPQSVEFNYSIKTTARATIKEYEKIRAQSSSSYEAIRAFTKNSKYFAQLKGNIKTLLNARAGYMRQYLDFNSIDQSLFPQELNQISELFSQSTINELYSQALEAAKSQQIDDINGEKCHFNPLDYIRRKKAALKVSKIKHTLIEDRDFVGVGRALGLGLKPEPQVKYDVRHNLERCMKGEFNGIIHYWAFVDGNGCLRIKMEDSSRFENVKADRDLFMRLSETYKSDPERSRIYKTLANLHGKNILAE